MMDNTTEDTDNTTGLGKEHTRNILEVDVETQS